MADVQIEPEVVDAKMDNTTRGRVVSSRVNTTIQPIVISLQSRQVAISKVTMNANERFYRQWRSPTSATLVARPRSAPASRPLSPRARTVGQQVASLGSNFDAQNASDHSPPCPGHSQVMRRPRPLLGPDCSIRSGASDGSAQPADSLQPRLQSISSSTVDSFLTIHILIPSHVYPV